MHLVLLLVALLILLVLGLLLMGAMISGPRYRGPVSDHFDGSTFINPGGAKAKGGFEVFKWMLSRKRGPWEEDKSEGHGPRPLAHFKGGIRVTFVNHSTFLIQVDGVNILTDPVWSKRVSPYRWIGPRRMRSAGIRFGDLPRIHVVLLTHNHYDHLDLDTMRLIFGAHHPRIIAPLGLKNYLDKEAISGTAELDWWQEVALEAGLQVRAVPAQHFSGRGLLDRDRTLWCGYIIKTSAGNIYFSGDTGYNGATFKEIRQKCGPVRLSMIPIGAYKPAWFMSPIHVSPEEAVRIHEDVQSQTSIAMHFGTFPLADDGQADPVGDLNAALQKSAIPEGEFLVPKEGAAIDFE
jgi:L-ascorbate metabolism protein UlaG (beta-lactamase superfamily)